MGFKPPTPGGTVGADALTTVVNASADRTAAAGDVTFVDATNGNVTITLPTTPTALSRVLVKKVDTSANTVTILPHGSGLIDRASSYVISVANGSATFQCLASDTWKIVSDVSPQSAQSGHVVEDEGTPLSARSKLNFTGAGVTATDNPGADSTDISISGAGVSDASTTVKGVTKLATAPVSASAPIAVGDNDPRVTADQAAGTASIRTLGTGAAQATAGNDARLSDTRTPTDGSVTAAKVNAALKPSGSAATTDESLRALGTTASTAAAGNHTHAGAAGVDEAINTVATSGAAQTIPAPTTATINYVTLTAGCTFTFPTAAAGRSFSLVLKQDAAGSRTVTWPGTVKWAAGTAPTLTTTAAKSDAFTFLCVDGTNWLGFTAGLNF